MSMRRWSLALILLSLACAVRAAPPTSLLPASISGWQRQEAPARYTPQTLYNYIDGQAEGFLAYGFRELAAARYAKGGSGFITVDAYLMGNPLDAFGLYAGERYPGARLVQVGMQGYLTPEMLAFWKGSYFVRVSAVQAGKNVEPLLVAFGRTVASKLPAAGASALQLLRRLPAKGKVPNSERYFRQGVMGQKFLRNGVTAVYRIDGHQATAFILAAGTPKEAARQLALLRRSERQSGETTAPLARGSAGFQARDRYHGRVAAGIRGRFVAGAYGQDQRAVKALALRALAGR